MEAGWFTFLDFFLGWFRGLWRNIYSSQTRSSLPGERVACGGNDALRVLGSGGGGAWCLASLKGGGGKVELEGFLGDEASAVEGMVEPEVGGEGVVGGGGDHAVFESVAGL